MIFNFAAYVVKNDGILTCVNTLNKNIDKIHLFGCNILTLL